MADFLKRILAAVVDWIFARRERRQKREQNSWDKQRTGFKDAAKRWREK